MGILEKTVNRDVMTNVMVVTTSMVSVIEDVKRAGRETIVNNVIYLPYTKIIFTSLKSFELFFILFL